MTCKRRHDSGNIVRILNFTVCTDHCETLHGTAVFVPGLASCEELLFFVAKKILMVAFNFLKHRQEAN